MKKYNVGIIGCTGMVGQRFATLLENHPWFNVTALAASSRSAGKTYKSVVEKRWAMKTPIPTSMADMIILDAVADMDEVVSKVDFVFCAVDMKKDEIRALEEAYAKKECPVVSNNSANRGVEDVPMVVPEINADHIEIINAQRKRLGTKRGFIAVKSNCSLQSYVPALRASLRQSPDVILLGEMRDYETMQVAMTAAETGHLLFSTLHTIGAANTIDRIIDVFPPNQQRQIAVQLSMVLQAVVSQQLVPTTDGGLTPAFEIMIVNPAIRNMIRDNKIPQIDGLIYSSAGNDLVSMDSSLLSLYKNGRITADTALAYASNPEMLKKKL